jgi:hypothetical protein
MPRAAAYVLSILIVAGIHFACLERAALMLA